MTDWLDELKRLEAAATPPPWKLVEPPEWIPSEDPVIAAIDRANDALTVALRNHARDLIAAAEDHAKLLGVVRTYCDSPGQIRGEAYRDMAGTLDAIDKPELVERYGWPACYERLKQRVAELEAENAMLRAMSILDAARVRELEEELAAMNGDAELAS